ncbi:MAG: amino acid ABC transporter substrate-binding protein [Lachnospiraceae bacterium]|nr:amino acid ABC transporter substrate-binding protein [Robinsoniella sp.]MDY3766765.1 amino acid ABC transporter substrate-binding protein [Lachnospiraceae bacterium]
MKRKVMCALLTIAMAASMLLGCSSKEESQTEAKVEATETETTKAADSDTFIVGFDQDFPPMGFVGDDGEFTGFDLDLAAEVAKRLGKEVIYQPIAWDAKDMELESGTIDCIWNGFTITGREENYTWTEPYMANKQVFVVKKDSGIESLEDLAGKTVDVQVDSSAEAALKEDENKDLAESFGELLTVADYNTAFMDLEAGAVDAIAMDDIVASYQIESRNADFVVLEEALAEEEYGVGFKKGNEELRDLVQKTLEEMAEDGTLAKISEEWFGKDITTIGK